MASKIIKPKKLTKGSKIGIIAVSNPLSKKHLEIIDKGCNKLKNMGFKVCLGKTIREHKEITAGTAKERAEDFMEMIKNKSISAIFFAWGGENGSQILPFLNFDEIKKNPKIIMGHSDPTVILNPVFDKCNLITFYGHLASSFDPNWEWFSEYDEKTFYDVLINPKETYSLPPSDNREVYREGICEGRLIGGCITDLVKLFGTPYQPNFESKVLFLESYVLKPQELLAHLTHLKQAGVFNQIKGLILGNFLVDDSKHKVDLKQLFLDELSEFKFPILKTKDFGHNSHMAPLPIGGLVRLNATQKQITFKEKNVI